LDKFKNISKQVVVLSLISLCNDAASELLIPVMPIYLTHIGYGALALGFIEGIAEAIAGIGKLYFGAISDKLGKRMPFIQWGYGISAASKPLLALFASPLWVLAMRMADRLGKGIRTGARDALLSAEATAETKASVFGFHRSMDTIGAVIGPLIAIFYLHYHPHQYAEMFAIAIVPGAISIMATQLLRENKIASTIKSTKATITNFWPSSSSAYKQILILLLIFSLANSSDAFLLLKLKEVGLSDASVILCYVAYNAVYAMCAYPMGIIADRIGMHKILALGLCIFSCVYFTFGSTKNVVVLIFATAIYGVYAACTEGVGKALLTNTCNSQDTGKAIGFFAAAQSISTLLASSIAGVMWHAGYARLSFMLSAALAFAVGLLFANYRVKK
jgi:MFS family permease